MEIGAFEILNEDVMNMIIDRLSNVDVLNLNEAYPKIQDFCELMGDIVYESEIEKGLTSVVKYLDDVDLLYFDEIFPEMKNNCPDVKQKVIMSVEKISAIWWSDETGLEKVIVDAQINCPECSADPYPLAQCDGCRKYIHDRCNLYDFKNKLRCDECRWRCYDEWQLKLHLDRREFNKKKGKMFACPHGYPRLSRKIEWGDLDVTSVKWYHGSWFSKEEVNSWLDLNRT